MFIAVRTGLEPATPGVTGRYSNQLNYRTKSSLLRNFFPAKEVFSSIADAKIRKKIILPNFFVKIYADSMSGRKQEGVGDARLRLYKAWMGYSGHRAGTEF